MEIKKEISITDIISIGIALAALALAGWNAYIISLDSFNLRTSIDLVETGTTTQNNKIISKEYAVEMKLTNVSRQPGLIKSIQWKEKEYLKDPVNIEPGQSIKLKIADYLLKPDISESHGIHTILITDSLGHQWHLEKTQDMPSLREQMIGLEKYSGFDVHFFNDSPIDCCSYY